MYEDNDDTKALKQQFALALLRTPNDAYGAARTVEPHPGKASWIVQNWSQAPDVLEYMSQAQITLGVQARLPSQAEFAAILLTDAQAIEDKETKLKYYKLFADVQGYIAKEGGNVTNNNLIVNKVMAYPMATSAEDWEAHAIRQQEGLLRQAQEGKVIEHAAIRA